MSEEAEDTNAIEQRARRAAKRAGLIAKKSRRRVGSVDYVGSVDNHGEFMLVDPYTNYVVAGERFDLSAEEVLTYCGGPDAVLTQSERKENESIFRNAK